MDEAIRLNIDKCRSYVNFMLSQQQWSGITKDDVDRWISNFRDLSNTQMLLVYKLLTSLIYFSEKDIISTLKEGIHNCLFNKIVLDKQKLANFELSPKTLSNIIQDELSKTCFIPLLDSNSPHESANYVTRLLVQQGIILDYQSIFLSKLVDSVQVHNFSRLVIVDDCVGSGDQLRGYWEKKAWVVNNKQVLTLKEYCLSNSIEVNYLTLFGYNQSIDQLKDEFRELQIFCVRYLTDLHRVFMKDSYIWNGEDELKQAIQLFSQITRDKGIPFLGHRNLDFAFIMHQTIPDWSLPLFWKENADWKLLLRRKNSSA